ncbi:ABC-three component system protein [Orenia marismortui]|uniref:ABC-three component systems C-terminal domain-containing protein n=1 Tax=Orenia marismortui TaxID=46469 RepID=A0A4R8GS44_9FIRM|nr:ABC-three component system protein [Orenia marismortui]TDX44477.1 hypothetical protein C7959_1545 [Orenia marismortui]
MSDTFNAGAAALGYFYQARYALFLLMKNHCDYNELSIERFDDVAFENKGTPKELIQLKHHQKSSSSLSNASVDVWKTLRIWCTQILEGELPIKGVLRTIITTESASKGSAMSKLKPDSRDEEKALDILNNIAETSTNSTNKKSYEVFSKLSKTEKMNLLQTIKIIDSSSNINDTKDDILKQLVYTARPKFLESVYERLEGWWFNKVVQHLSCDSKNLITHQELLSKIIDIQEQFHEDNLPIDFFESLEIDESELNDKEKIFIEQLKLVSVGETRIKKAISDYYKAYQQRSKWIREDLLIDNELENYEKRLIDEWERRFEIMKEDIENKEEKLSEKAIMNEGRGLYNWVTQKADINIRPKCVEPYIMRGSYHMLANNLNVGWHIDFLDRLKKLLSNDKEAA